MKVATLAAGAWAKRCRQRREVDSVNMRNQKVYDKIIIRFSTAADAAIEASYQLNTFFVSKISIKKKPSWLVNDTVT